MALGDSTMTIDLRPGEQVLLDGRRIMVALVEKSGKLARLQVTAPRDVKIEREDCDQSRAMRDKIAS